MLKYLVIFAGIVGLALPAIAKEKLAIVIANDVNSEDIQDKPAKNGIKVSQTLLGLGFDVRRLENIHADDNPLAYPPEKTVLLFFSGNASSEGGKTRLLSVERKEASHTSGWILEDLIRSYQEKGAERVLVFLDVCHRQAGETANVLPMPPHLPNIFLAQAGPPGTDCPNDGSIDFTKTMLKAILVPKVSLSETFSDAKGIWTFSTLAEPFVLNKNRASGKSLSVDDLEMLSRLSETDRNQILALWRRAGIINGTDGSGESGGDPLPEFSTVRQETIILTAPAQPEKISEIITPMTTTASSLRQEQNSVRIFTVSANASREFRPAKTGMPTPSIIVGNIKSQDAFLDPTRTGGAISANEMGVANFDDRHRIKNENPALYEQLLTSGAFDPDKSALAGAIQTELARMGCYSARVDGIWGNGSRAAVGRYFKQIGSAAPTQEPTVELYRQILRKDDAACPAVRTTSRSHPVTSRQGAGRTVSNRTPSTPRTAPAKPDTATGPRTIKRNLNPAGVFR